MIDDPTDPRPDELSSLDNDDQAFTALDQSTTNGKGGRGPKDYVIGVVLHSGGMVINYYWNKIDLRVGDSCIVDDDRNAVLGSVSITRRPTDLVCQKKQPRGMILRQASDKDVEQAASTQRKEKAAMNYCRERILERDLEMNLSRVSYSLDGRKATFYFTAENRVDFRELVKDLTNYTHVKVHMRQIGVRDEARMLGGCGPCGQELCCSMFLNEFAPVSIRMAKDQMLSLSQEKISGVCGRLMCCLAYEHPVYKEKIKLAPKMGKTVMTPEGRQGRVVQLNLIKEIVGISFEDGSKATFTVEEMSLAKQGIFPAAPSAENEPSPLDVEPKERRPKQTVRASDPKRPAAVSSDGDSAKTGRPRHSRRRKRPDQNIGQQAKPGNPEQGKEHKTIENSGDSEETKGLQPEAGRRRKRRRRTRRGKDGGKES